MKSSTCPTVKAHDSLYSADLIHRHALEFLQQQQGRPFFLFLAYTLPHAQLQVPHDSVYQHYLTEFHEAPGGAAPHAKLRSHGHQLDCYVGEIINRVKQLGLTDNTLILFTSDNGPHRGRRRRSGVLQTATADSRGIKRDLYEGRYSGPLYRPVERQDQGGLGQ